MGKGEITDSGDESEGESEDLEDRCPFLGYEDEVFDRRDLDSDDGYFYFGGI